MKQLLDFDDPGAGPDEPVKGVTVGNIRAWHDQYDRLLSSWAECRDLLSRERAAKSMPIEPSHEMLSRLARAMGYTIEETYGTYKLFIECPTEATLPTKMDEMRTEIVALRDAAADALAGWRYIRANHGDLYGVGWDRVESKLTAVMANNG